MYVAVSVGDEAFNTVHHPRTVLFLGSLEHDGLEVGTGIRLSEVHRHGLSCADTRDVLLLLLVGSEFIYRLGAVLESPQVLEARICTAHDVGSHDIRRDGEVQASEAARHRHAHKSGLAAGVKVLLGAFGIYDTAVFHAWAVVVNILSVFGDYVSADFADDLKHLVV